MMHAVAILITPTKAIAGYIIERTIILLLGVSFIIFV